MKELILKKPKITKILLIVLSILFLILIILNLCSTKRQAYKSMYDANYEMYSAYEEYAEKFESYGYYSKADEMRSNAAELDDKLDRYKNELAKLNMPIIIYAILIVGSILVFVWVIKQTKNDINALEEIETEIVEE